MDTLHDSLEQLPQLPKKDTGISKTSAAFGIGRECVKLIEGTYTRRLLLVTICVDAASAVLSAVWLCNPQIINPAFTDAMAVKFAGEDVLLLFMTNFNIFFLCCILFALALDLGVVIWKYYKCTR